MLVIHDPEGAETAALHDFVDFAGKHVLEVGCGDGRMTWRFADTAAHVTGIDPDPDDIATALENRPARLRDRVAFLASSLKDFTLPEATPKFDVAILSWSL
jgi:2-polyprenyl-3-methyl-5-hydroxy-6-metoxy-1,4-benzoquinol methylase